MAIKCGNCTQYHDTIQDVRKCCVGAKSVLSTDQTVVLVRPEPPVAPYVPEFQIYPGRHKRYTFNRPQGPPSQRQLSWYEDLGGDPEWAATELSCQELADRITDRLNRRDAGVDMAGDAVVTTTSAPVVFGDRTRNTTKVPLVMLREIPDGYYAAQMDTTQPWQFLRVSRPKKNKLAGCIKIQSQHSDVLKNIMLVYPDDSLAVFDRSYEDAILLSALDPVTAHIAYGRKMGYCCCCGKQLTDPRSRYYGIGPDCEKRNELIIIRTNETDGPYVPGDDE